MSCTTRKSSRPSTSRSVFWLIHEWAGLVAMTHRPLILPGEDAFDDLVVGPTVLGRGCGRRRCPGCRRPSARCVGVREVVAAEQVRRVAEQPRAHRVALAGDRVGPGARPADVAGHQGQVDDRLRRAHALVALVDAHRPPERDALALVDRAGPRRAASPRRCPVASATRSRREVGDVLAELLEAARVRGDERLVDPALANQEVGQAVEQRQVRLGRERPGAASPPSPFRSCADRRR